MLQVRLEDDLRKLDYKKATEMLAEAQWCKGITQAEVEFSAKHSAVVIGAYLDQMLVGYMRVVSDRARYAYVLDVIVDPRYRRQGIGQTMVKHALEHPKLHLVYQWMLRTRDAHGVYAKAGFRKMVDPEQWMLIQNNRPQRNPFPVPED